MARVSLWSTSSKAVEHVEQYILNMTIIYERLPVILNYQKKKTRQPDVCPEI